MNYRSCSEKNILICFGNGSMNCDIFYLSKEVKASNPNDNQIFYWYLTYIIITCELKVVLTDQDDGKRDPYAVFLFFLNRKFTSLAGEQYCQEIYSLWTTSFTLILSIFHFFSRNIWCKYLDIHGKVYFIMTSYTVPPNKISPLVFIPRLVEFADADSTER